MGIGEFFIGMDFVGSNANKIALGVVNNQGARSYQEDSFGFSSIDQADVDRYGFTAIVADGMGGISGGAQVSSYVVTAMLGMQTTRDPNVPVHAHLSGSLRAVNNSIVQSGMSGGSTAVVVMCIPAGIHWCTVGDSRVYLFREGCLTVMNEDSDYMNQLIEQVISGEMTFDEAGDDEKKDSLARYMGYKGEITPDVNAKPLVPKHGDKLMLCSDGVYNALTEAELIGALSLPADQAASALETAVVSKGYPTQDNFTAVVLEFIR